MSSALEAPVTTGDLIQSIGTSVLLVEDNPGDARLVERMLQQQNAAVELVVQTSIAGAVEALEARDFSIVLLDLSLADARGIEGVREIHHRYPSLPLIVLTGFADQRLALKAVKAGAQDFLIKGRVDPAALIHAMQYAIERKRTEQRLAFLAHHDELTGLANRIKLKESLDRALDRCRRSGGRCAVLFLDLDGFKRINDTLGHDAGDLLLEQVARRLETCVRSFELVSRLGGDEFVILLEHIDTAEDAVVVARRALDVMKTPFSIPQLEERVGTSVGVAISEPGDSIESMLDKADHAMYRAKRSGRGTFAVYVPDSVQGELSTISRDVESRLRELGFQLLYEPWMSLSDSRVLAVEAKLRWRHPVHGDMEGAEVWPHLDQAGVVRDVMNFVLEQAMRSASRWGLGEARLVLPVFDKVALEEQFPDVLRQLAMRLGVPLGRVELAIPEESLLNRAEALAERLEKLRAIGLRLAVDGFGARTGLDNLARLPLDTVRLNPSLTADIQGFERRQALIRAVVELARSLAMEVFVSGVETVQEEDILSELGCTGMSGHIVSPALPSDAFAVWLSHVS